MADAICTGGASGLSARGWQAIGREKSLWAEKISPYMDVWNNRSPSFTYFKEKLLEVIGLSKSAKKLRK
jgi:hypothetical protein